MIPKTIVLLLSGGLDSVTALYKHRHDGDSVHAVLVDYKQPHVQELTFAKHHCHRLGVMFTTVDIPALGGLTEESWIIPNRNAILLSIACNIAVRAKAEIVTIGCNKDDEATFPDCRMAFIQTFNVMLSVAQIPVEVCAPFLDWPKTRIFALAQELGVESDFIWTCYKGGAKPCGVCPACLKLQAASK